MINIDWSYAPSGATHFHKGDIMYRPHWRKSGFYCDLGLEAFGWIKDTYPSPISECIERPKKQEAWDGEGLPPEKCDCEVLWSSDTGEYVTATVLAHDQGGAIVRYTSGKNKGCISEQIVGCFNFKGCQIPNFRPIKTAEQLAEEEREKAIADMMEVTSDGISCIGQDDAIALYKAGYRKQ